MLLSTTQILDILNETHVRRLKIREETNWLETVRSEEHGREFHGFSFCLTYPRLGAGEASNPEKPMDTSKKNVPKSQLSIVNICSSKTLQKKFIPTPSNGKPVLLPAPGS